MIHETAAAIIAQVFPVGLVLLAVESRNLQPRSTDMLWYRIYRRVQLVFMFSATLLSLWSVAVCIGAVIERQSLDRALATIVVIAGYVLLGAVSWLTAEILGSSLFTKSD